MLIGCSNCDRGLPCPHRPIIVPRDNRTQDDLVLHNALVVLTELAKGNVWRTDKPQLISRAEMARWALACYLEDE